MTDRSFASWSLRSLLVFSVACGGEVSSIGSSHARSDAGPPADTGPDADDAARGCGTRPVLPDAAPPSGCAHADCPSGTVCVELDSDDGFELMSCVTIPPECADHATCSCMGTVAYECVTKTGTPPGMGEGCQDVSRDGGAAIVFSCLDCDGTQGLTR